MTIVLNHTIVPVAAKHRGARLFADLLGIDTTMESGPFAAVRVNDDLTFDFDDRLGSRPGHYAFLVDDGTFDHALATAETARLKWGSAPASPTMRSTITLAGVACISATLTASPMNSSPPFHDRSAGRLRPHHPRYSPRRAGNRKEPA
jgi:hypothetical protein